MNGGTCCYGSRSHYVHITNVLFVGSGLYEMDVVGRYKLYDEKNVFDHFGGIDVSYEVVKE